MGAIKDGSGDRYGIGKDEKPVPEGIEGRVPYKGELASYLYQLVAGPAQRHGVLRLQVRRGAQVATGAS